MNTHPVLGGAFASLCVGLLVAGGCSVAPQELAPSSDSANNPATKPGNEKPNTDDREDDDPGRRKSDCGFNYTSVFGPSPSSATFDPTPLDLEPGTGVTVRGVDIVAHAEPRPLGVSFSDSGLTMPTYRDSLPLFERAEAWNGDTRCFELPTGATDLTEAEAFDLYVEIAEKTTGTEMDLRSGVRNVVGIRGAYPGSLEWHGNAPNKFNDTIVLLWKEGREKRVLEFPVTTETGAKDFGRNSSSQLRPNRRYSYKNGWHRGYNAIAMSEWNYPVRDDTNNNGHWDSDRNGWKSGGAKDYDRDGGAHNIHMASVSSLGAPISTWSAGCQVIPGTENWTQFVETAWVELGEPVDYYLVDVRDIDSRVWDGPCEPDGTHACPYDIDRFPFVDYNDTTYGESLFDQYNCSLADESGPEIVYLLTVDGYGTLDVSVDSKDGADIDVHLLDADDADACLTRGHLDLSKPIGPGRYYVIADSWVDEGTEFSGEYRLRVDLR